jgi:hypothetical protein
LSPVVCARPATSATMKNNRKKKRGERGETTGVSAKGRGFDLVMRRGLVFSALGRNIFPEV